MGLHLFITNKKPTFAIVCWFTILKISTYFNLLKTRLFQQIFISFYGISTFQMQFIFTVKSFILIFNKKTSESVRYYEEILRDNFPIKRRNLLFDNDKYNQEKLHLSDKASGHQTKKHHLF